MNKNVFPQLLQVGGPFGFLDEWGGEIIRSTPQKVVDGGSFVADAVGDLFKQNIIDTSKEKQDPGEKTEIGGKTELRFDKRGQEYKEKIRVANFRKELTQAQKQAMEEEAKKKAISKQRENVIRTIGGITNLSYQDVVDENGVMRTDVEAWFNRKNSEMKEQDLRKQKQNQVAQATGKINYFMQHNMAGERAGGQHVLSAVG